MNRIHSASAVFALSCALGSLADTAAPVPEGSKPPLEAIQRQDPTGQGTFNREGHLRREGEAVAKLDKLESATTNKVAATNVTAAAEGAAKKGDTK